MRSLKHGVACLILAILPTTLTAQDNQLSADKIASYLSHALEKYSDANSMRWESRMYRTLMKNGDADATAQALAREDGLAVDIEKSLIALWITGAETVRVAGGEARQVVLRQLWEQGLAQVRASGYHQRVTEVVLRATSLMPRTVEQFDAILAGAADGRVVGIAAAEEADRTLWWLALHARYPNDATILTALSRREKDLPLAARLALLQELARQWPSSREQRLSLKRQYASALWNAGLVGEGLAIVNSPPNGDRRLLLSRQTSAADKTDFRLDYIAALFVTGRTAEARREFGRLPSTKQLRPLWDCPLANPYHQRNRPPDRCSPINSEAGAAWRVIEMLLNRPAEDPYMLVETGGFFSGSALGIEISRRLLSGDNYAAVRRNFAERWVRQTLSPPAPEMAAQLRFVRSDLLAAAGAYEKKLRATASQWNVNDTPGPPPVRTTAATPAPMPPGFRELPLPETFRSDTVQATRTTPWPSQMSTLPKGFSPVRVEQGQLMTIAISLSHTLDPTGEVSQGGYWVHLSRDGGRTWDAPLYTGLVQYFPYVVLPASKMPLWSSDRITVEIEVKELDPSSITYPPVALRSRRQARDFYLDIPLTALQSDRDHDGLTDIVEERLLLDADRADTDGDGVDDGTDSLPNVRSASARPDSDYVERILQLIFDAPGQAIIEPVDRPAQPSVQASRAAPLSPIRPILVEGRPEDFAGLRTISMVLVYSPGDMELLRAHSPDFHALSLDTAVFNRAHDRGHISWSLGWTGGTLRLIRTGQSWRVEIMSHWIT